MYKIKKCNIDEAEKIQIATDKWKASDYEGKAFVQIVCNDNAFVIRFTVYEKNPLRVKTKMFDAVCTDSCVEFFVNFTPNNSDKYINFESNANGVMNCSYRKDRYESEFLKEAEVLSLNNTPNIYDDYWTLSYSIPYELIKSYYPAFDIEKCDYIIGNLYKCGENVEKPHFLSLFEINTPKPDFHRPEFFGKFKVEY